MEFVQQTSLETDKNRGKDSLALEGYEYSMKTWNSNIIIIILFSDILLFHSLTWPQFWSGRGEDSRAGMGGGGGGDPRGARLGIVHRREVLPPVVG